MTPANNPDQNPALTAAARAYALNGYIKLTNLFSRSEIEVITTIYDGYHSSVQRIATDGESRIPPTGSLLENSPELTELIFSKSELLNIVRAATGADVQFAGSDAVHVYNDSIGIHRDTFCQYDFPKILIFLSDTPPKANFADPIEQRHAGAFMVMPGTHTLKDEYTALSSRLCNWPYEKSELYSEINPNFTLVQTSGGTASASRKLDQQRQNRNKYSAFTKINFRKGDIVLFSTRMLHALYPLFDTLHDPEKKQTIQSKKNSTESTDKVKQPCYKPLKLLGILLMEGYSLQNGEPLESAIKNAEINSTAVNGDLIDYIATAYNLRLYNTIVDHGAAADQAIASVTGRAMGLNRSLAKIRNSEARAAVERHNLIHAFYEKHSQIIDIAAGLNSEEIHSRFLKQLRHHDSKIRLQDERIKSNLDFLADEQPSLVGRGITHQRSWRGIAKYLPLIHHEKVYLFYEKFASLLARK